ncbi:ABC transporter substrate-binding protein (plasmid) [Shinella sp. H4-D48]|uniref:ABC transporter substrate-binding protein n=1 Tax=Shinella sp. H4-D48 TaxID=2925841 RepID=UPI001F532B0C|nr:ABC transporter substrate-binding protein [Shinella sp. H4-D48]UNK39958.1 ABC transporter substrate-binding protein [Shinella sp. H4-D48]
MITDTSHPGSPSGDGDLLPKKGNTIMAGTISMKRILASTCLLSALSAGHALAAECSISIGRVVPITGPLADVTKDTPWVDENKIKPINDAGGLKVGDELCKINYKIYDSKSTVAGSADAATQAILQDKVDFLIAQGTPDTTNAPSDLCERNKIPCVVTGVPIEAWLLGPDGKPKEYKYTFAFYFSVGDLVKNHLGMIKALPGGFNGKIGYLYPNDADGTVFAKIFDPVFKQEGWTPVDPGRFQQGLPDFSSLINQFKRNHVEVVTGVLAPPDMQNYLQQAAQAGFKPKMYIIDKGTGYPEPMAALGEAGYGLLSVNFWSPAYPGNSTYGGYDGQTLVDRYEEATGKPYVPPLGYDDASYDVLLSAIQRAGTKDRDAVLAALKTTKLDTVDGPIAFNSQNYSVQPLAGAQWRFDEATGKIVKETVFNEVYPSVKKTGEMKLYE